MNEKPKICVYAICKNESKFIRRWLNSIKEADYIVVLDTGSTDDSVSLLKQYGLSENLNIRVEKQIFEPFRFDAARNVSMTLIPDDTDICVVSDFDQIFREGWSNELRRLFLDGYEEIYGDIIDYDENEKEVKRFLSKNVHPNDKKWYWERPVHEGIYFHGDREVKSIVSELFVIEHHPDKTKSRDQYLEILENEYKTNRKDPYCAIYYGCELSFHGRNEESFRVFMDALNECDFSNTPEIGYQICLNISNEYERKKLFKLALEYAKKASEYGINTRRLWVRIASLSYNTQDYSEAIENSFKALSIQTNVKSWIETQELFNNAEIYTLLSLSFYKQKKYLKALAYGELAVKIEPENQTLKNNIRYYMKDYERSLYQKSLKGE